jgi:hypothetical protein
MNEIWAGIVTTARETEASRGLFGFVISPDAAAVIKAAGMGTARARERSDS